MLRLLQKPNLKTREHAFFEKLDVLEHQIAGRFSRGNFAIQDGCVLDEEGLEAERDALRKSLAGY